MMQFRIRAETVKGGIHKSMTEPSSSTMFDCAGETATSTSKKSDHSDAVTEAVSQITAVLASKLAAAPPTKANSPAKIIDN